MTKAEYKQVLARIAKAESLPAEVRTKYSALYDDLCARARQYEFDHKLFPLRIVHDYGLTHQVISKVLQATAQIQAAITPEMQEMAARALVDALTVAALATWMEPAGDDPENPFKEDVEQ